MQDLGRSANSTPTVNSTLTEWLDYMQQIHVSAIDMGLERVMPVFAKLLLPKNQAFVFTVAGTNGKGSTTATIARICEQAGYKTALYQSPHLLVFNERIKINGQMVSDETLIQAFVQVENARLACGLTLSFFEMTTLAAFLIFQQANCEVWVLEIGLGGRLDVVNVIDPDLAVITNIGIDHVEWLGDTREKIAIEKAGILRQGITLVYAEKDMPSTLPPLIASAQVNLQQYGSDYSYQPNSDHSRWQYTNGSVTMSLPTPSLSLHNTATAITAVIASPLSITQSHIEAALPTVSLAGRFDQRTFFNRQWLFDVAHNEHGMTFLLSQLTPWVQQYQQQHPHAHLHLIISMLADKDISPVLAKLQQFSQTIMPILSVHSGVINHPRASSKARLTEALPKYFTNIHIFDDLEAATQSAIRHSQTQDIILVCGSFYTISHVLTSNMIATTC